MPRKLARALACLSIALVAASCASTPAPRSPAFLAVPLGTSGGLLEEDLTAFLLAPAGSVKFVALDAGTLWSGLRRAAAKGAFAGLPIPRDEELSLEGWILRKGIGAVALSHPHLDHVSGLVIDSPEDGPKPVYGFASTLDPLRTHIFNPEIWVNFTDEGDPPRLGKYRFVRLTPGEEVPFGDGGMFLTPFPLAHAGPDRSTAFLVRSGGDFALYVGDTGPDAVERSNRLGELWTRMAPLVRNGALRVIFLECSFPDERPDGQLFGHLTPRHFATELGRLRAEAGTLEGVSVVVTHRKPSTAAGEDVRERIVRELRNRLAPLGVTPVVPEAGVPLRF